MAVPTERAVLRAQWGLTPGAEEKMSGGWGGGVCDLRRWFSGFMEKATKQSSTQGFRYPLVSFVYQVIAILIL